MSCLSFKQLSLLLLCCLAAHPALAQSYSEQISAALERRNSGDFAGAEVILREVHQSTADQRETAFLLAMTIAFQERFDEAETLLRDALDRYRQDVTLRIGLARVLSFQGNYAAARQEAARVLESEPENTEALNLSARIALYQDQPGRAETIYRQVLGLDADNLEAHIGLYDAAVSQGNLDAASNWIELAAGIAPESPDVRTRQERQLYPEPSWQVTYGYGNSRFKRIPLDNWHDAFIEVHRQNGRGDDLYARLEGQEHFGMSDTVLSLGTVRSIQSGMPWGMRLDASPDAVFVPDYRLSGFVAPRLREGGDTWGTTVLNLSAQHASYAEAEVSQIGLAVDQYLFDGRVWITPSTTLVADENGDTLSGWNLRANWLVNPNILVGGGYGEAPQTEAATTAITRTSHIFTRLTVSDSVDLRIDLVREDRENSYIRYATALALTWKY